MTRAEACKILYNVYTVYQTSIENGYSGIQAPQPDALSGVKYDLIEKNSESHINGLAIALSYFPKEFVEEFIADGTYYVQQVQGRYNSVNADGMKEYIQSLLLSYMETHP